MTPGAPTYGVRGLAVASALAVGAATLCYLLTALFPLVGVQMARSAAEQLDRDVLLGVVLVEVLFTLPYLLALLTAGTLVVIWTWRARKNLDAFPGAVPSLSPAWAIAGWLVPFANLVVPARVLADLLRNSVWQRRQSWLVGVWWASWLVFLIGDRFVARAEQQRYDRLTELPRNDAEFATYVRFYEEALAPRLTPAVACLVAGVAFVVLVRRISAAQQDRLARAVPAWPGQPVWPGHPGWPAPAAFAPAAPAAPVAAGAAGPRDGADGASATSPQVPPGPNGTIGA
ncbi:DUF4328 domain-containing protein [Micromonospora sp. C32]|uniref:DUF4328 domain-containing protein n=1 Tax=unclassified Micromonospora TaxID=2617518 RepID=UPI0027DC78D0|nr:DUF4328 domain-containing protein [Micromonospora sp. C32]